ncbi:tape measure protein [Bosea sp. (in: a-proteobacteria)]|jgi:tape measure domain-containing protein|uniref:tape measure protein n=1 Tax=Bosea sp. (in: a-proteobacteria) TaxID=1871050 RepID=UPI003F6E4756
MATEVERMTVVLEANVTKFQNTMKRQQAQFSKITKEIEAHAARMESSVGSSFASLGKRMAGAFAGIAAGVGLNEFRKTADEYTRIVNSLKVAGVSGGALPGTLDALFASAQKNAVPLEALASLYGRVSQAQTTLKASSQEVLQVTDIVAQSLRVSGKSASESSGALLQLAQAFSNGKVQAEEYNSLLDGAYPLLQAAAAGMKEAGGDVAKLTALVKDGKVSSEAFFRAIQAGAPLLEEKLAGAALTTEQAMTKLRNEFTLAVGKFDEATGASQALAGGLSTLASSIGGIGSAATGAVTGVQALINKVAELAAANAGAQRAQALTYQQERAGRTDAAREMGTANAGGRLAVSTERQTKLAQDIAAHVEGDINSAFDIAGRSISAPQPTARPKGLGSTIKPISLADFKVPGGKDGGGGGGGSSKEALDAYDRELAAIQKRTAALDLEAASVGKSTFERAKAKAALDLETAAKKTNIPVTAELKAKIDEAATGYANARVKVDEVTKAYEAAKESGEFFGSEITDSLSDMVFEGKKAEDVIKSLAKAIGKAALESVLLGKGPLGGLVGGSTGIFGNSYFGSAA